MRRLREQRFSMCETDRQYKLVYDLVRNYYQEYVVEGKEEEVYIIWEWKKIDSNLINVHIRTKDGPN